MIFFIKFIYQTFLLPPGILIIFIFAFSLWLLYKKHIKIARVLLIFSFLFYLFTTPFVGDHLIRSLEKQFTPPSNPNGDVIIMLGGGATLDTPSVNGYGHLSGYAANRLLTCAQLYNKLKVPVIITGGQVMDVTGPEAKICKTILLGLGIPEDKILLETKSLNTTQNAEFTKKILENQGFRNPILVTSAFHMARAVRQFKKVGIEVLPYPTDYQVNIHSSFRFSDFVPSAQALTNAHLALKEYIGILAVKWY
ncbi:MAG: YdcF family protein [Clostridia bacterium]|nr:YdcF family protein [Clostridia bacterium]